MLLACAIEILTRLLPRRDAIDRLFDRTTNYPLPQFPQTATVKPGS
jgi:hypothetical protein